MAKISPEEDFSSSSKDVIEAMPHKGMAENGDEASKRKDGTRRKLSSETSRPAVGLGDMSMGKIPPKAERLKDSEGLQISKLCGESEWQPRLVVITAEKIMIAHPDHPGDVSEQIPLHEISSCDKMTGHGDDIIAFVINTIPGGYNCGRQYIFSVENEQIFEEWDSFIEAQSAIAFKRVNKHTPIEEARERARNLLKAAIWQYTFGLIIVANFAVNIGQACVEVGVYDASAAVHRRGTTTVSESIVSDSANQTSHPTTNDSLASSRSMFYAFDVVFTLLFSIELALNLFGNWFWEFVNSGWSIFDFTVVIVSIVSLSVPNGPQWILVLRTMRIFRILRLFNKMRALRTIINALLAALPIVFQAFMIMALCLFVFAIVGQNLFLKLSPKRFGNFKVALFSVFQVLTLDVWSEVADAVKDTSKYGHEDVDPTSALFFCVLIITCNWVLLPVIVAVLLDNFVISVKAEEKQAIIDEELEEMRKAGVSKAITISPIHPVLETLAKFKNSRDLSHKIQALFMVLDCDRGGTLSFQEISEGLRRMEFTPPIALSQDDYFRMTRQGELCDEEQSLDPAAFEVMMRAELEDHIEHKVAAAYEESQKNEESPESTALLASVKLLKMLSRHDEASNMIEHLQKFRAMQREVMAAMEASKRELQAEILALEERKLSLRNTATLPSDSPPMEGSNFLADSEPECRDSEEVEALKQWQA